MAGDKDAPPSLSEKSLGAVNIKTFVPLTLDLDELNYDAWRELFETHCITFGVDGHLTGASTPSASTDTDWQRSDSLVKLWIYGTISKSLLQMILKKGVTAATVWTNLENLFRDNKDARAIHLENEIRTLTLGDMSITEYCHRLKTTADLLENIDAKVPEKTLVTYMINGLSDKFDNVATIIRHRDPLPTFLQARSMLLLEEQRLNRPRHHTATHNDIASSPTILHTAATPPTSAPHTRPPNRHNSRGRHPRPPHRYNHRPSNPPYPWNPYGWGYPPPPWKHSQSPRPSPSFSRNPHPKPGLLGPPPQTATIASSDPATPPPWTWFPGVNTGQATTLPQAFHTLSLQEPEDNGWYMDTGATSHLAADKGILSSYFNNCMYSSVTVGNGSSIPVITSGHKQLPNPHRPLHLNNVLVTPNIIKNLISVRQFTRDNKCTIEFDAFGFSVKDFQTRQLLLRCDSQGDLYPATFSSASPIVLHSSSQPLWHQRLGHPHDDVLHKLVSRGFFSCSKLNKTTLCHACQLGKHVKLLFSHSTPNVISVFDIVHSDLWTSPIPSVTGIKYYVLFLDQFSHFLWVYPLRRKNDVFNKFLHFMSYVKTQFGCGIKSLQCDHGGEFDNKLFHECFDKNGIQFRFSCPRTSQQNGRSERMIRTINNLIRTILFQAHLPPQYWVEALHMATHLLNILPSTSINHDIPFVKLFGKPPSYSHLRVFGCLCYPHLDSPHKLAPRATPCIFLGYPSHHRGFRCLDLATSRIIISRHVRFDETTFPFSSMTPNNPPSYKFLDTVSNLPRPTHILNQSISTHPTNLTHNIPPSNHSTPPTAPNPINPSTAPTPPSPPPNQPTPSNSPTPPPPPPTNYRPHPMTTRSRTGSLKPIQKLNLHVSLNSPIPKSHIQALDDPNWKQAMLDEYNALIKNGTWVLVPRPKGVNIVRSMWLYKHKIHADGTLERYKARLVANGRSQRPGLDCAETFSPVVKPATIRTVLSLALSRDWPIHQLDVKNAFLHGNLRETVYMHQPPGFVCPTHPDYVCHLRKSLYGLKQAPRAWYHRFGQYTKRIGFQHSRCDSSLFIFQHGKSVAYLLLYVDDIILTASTTDLLHKIILLLRKEFAMTDLGDLNYFLGISVSRTAHGMFLSQQKYATEILTRANMLNCKPVSTPVDTHSKLGPDGPPVADPTLYRSLAGALQYLTFTRPDITYAVQQLCLYMHDPREPHFTALKRVLRYVCGTLYHGLQLFRSSTDNIFAYSDADWGGCPSTRRSTSGYCVFLGDNLLSWSSKRQATISRSSAEAEYRAVANAVAETSWIRNLLRELLVPLSKATIVYCDNVSAVYLSTNPVQHQRTKHIEIDIHFVRDKVATGEVRVLHVPTTSQYADILTKGLPSQLFSDFRSTLNVRSPDVQSAGEC